MDELALGPQSGAGIAEVHSLRPAGSKVVSPEPFVEARQGDFRSLERAGDLAPWH
jgi:hypothetical protein